MTGANLSGTFFNHRDYFAESRLEKGSFAAAWWRIYSGDPRWTPPYYPSYRRALDPGSNRHLRRMEPVFFHNEAIEHTNAPGKRIIAGGQGQNLPPAEPFFELPVAASVILFDRRREDHAGYLAMLHSVNDSESLRHHVRTAAGLLRERGCRRIIAVTGISPHLESGVLQDYWGELPPLYTPYNPPYLPEVISSYMQVLETRSLYYLSTGLRTDQPDGSVHGTETIIEPLQVESLAGELLPLLRAACPQWAGCPPPDKDEALFLMSWVGVWPLHGWLARVGSKPAGFVLLQGDYSPALFRARGGRNLAWRLWLNRAASSPIRRGRLLFGGVLPEYRRQGIGSRLLGQALVTAQELGWDTLIAGPIPEGEPAAIFLDDRGAKARQTYRLYYRDIKG